MFKKISLELGGKNPNIIFSDSDFDKKAVVSLINIYKSRSNLVCGSRIFIQEDIYKIQRPLFQKLKTQS